MMPIDVLLDDVSVESLVVFRLPCRLYFYLICTPKTLPSFTHFSGVTECGHLNSLRAHLGSCRTRCNPEDRIA